MESTVATVYFDEGSTRWAYTVTKGSLRNNRCRILSLRTGFLPAKHVPLCEGVSTSSAVMSSHGAVGEFLDFLFSLSDEIDPYRSVITTRGYTGARIRRVPVSLIADQPTRHAKERC